jgi:hypothetical protein
MSAFLAGALFGFLFMGGVFVIFVTRTRAPKKEIADWREDTYQQPPVKNRVLIQERHFEL